MSAEFPYIFAMSSDRFDPSKDASNVVKHGLSLAFGDRIFEDGDHVNLETIRVQDGETRFKVVGEVNSKVFTGVFVWRDGQPRFISDRRANRAEERDYRNPG